MRGLRSQRIVFIFCRHERPAPKGIREQPSESQLAQADAAIAEKPAAGDGV
jgi:hypothetical protein